MSELSSISAFDRIATPGRHGNGDGDAGVTVCELVGLGLASIAVRKGQTGALKSAVRTAYGVDLPDRPIVAEGEDVRFIGTGPGQWFAVSRTLQHEALADALGGELTGLAAIADQSSGWTVLRLGGVHCRDVLAKGLPIDLDPRVFPPGAAANGTIAHMGVLVWRQGEDYDVALFRSVAGSFWRWLVAAGAEYGLEVVTTS